jgi:cyclohexanone monooxygenase
MPGMVGEGANAPAPPREEQLERYVALWEAGGIELLLAYPNMLTNIEVNDTAATFVREKIAEKVRDPKVAAALSPRDHPFGTKRICVDTGYFETFNRPNVELVDLRATPIEAITPDGVRTSAGDYALDAIVFATGFDAMTGALLAMDIRGAGGATLSEAWDKGPRTYLGLAVADFPNLFIVTGPGSPSVISNMMASIEQHVDWIADCIGHMRARGLSRISAEPAAQEAWTQHVNEVADRSLFPRANSWYVGANIPGKPRVFMAYIGAGYRERCDRAAAAGYEGFALS